MDATGYGTTSRGYVLALDQLGFDVKIEPYSWHFPIKDKKWKIFSQSFKIDVTDSRA